MAGFAAKEMEVSPCSNAMLVYCCMKTRAKSQSFILYHQIHFFIGPRYCGEKSGAIVSVVSSSVVFFVQLSSRRRHHHHRPVVVVLSSSSSRRRPHSRRRRRRHHRRCCHRFILSSVVVVVVVVDVRHCLPTCLYACGCGG